MVMSNESVFVIHWDTEKQVDVSERMTLGDFALLDKSKLTEGTIIVYPRKIEQVIKEEVFSIRNVLKITIECPHCHKIWNAKTKTSNSIGTQCGYCGKFFKERIEKRE